MTSRQQTSLIKSSKSYFINTRKTKRDVDLKPLCKLIEDFAESSPFSADKQPGFSGQSVDKKTFSANKDSFTSNFNFKLQSFWSHNADSWLALCDSKFTIAGTEAPVLKFMTNLETLNTGQL